MISRGGGGVLMSIILPERFKVTSGREDSGEDCSDD